MGVQLPKLKAAIDALKGHAETRRRAPVEQLEPRTWTAMPALLWVSRKDSKDSWSTFSGARLPTEVEREYATRIGLAEPDRPDSGAFDPSGEPVANTCKGVSPIIDRALGGFSGNSPVGHDRQRPRMDGHTLRAGRLGDLPQGCAVNDHSRDFPVRVTLALNGMH